VAKRSRRPITPRPGQAPSSNDSTDAPSASSAGAEAQTSAPGPSTTRSRSSRNRSGSKRRTVAAEPTFFERYRALIIGGVAVVAVLVIGYLIFFNNSGPQGTFAASGPKYVCDTLLTPGPSDTLPPPAPSVATTPAPTPAASAAPESSGQAAQTAAPTAAPSPTAEPSPTPEPTLRLGFGTEILGRNHILDPNQTIEYGFCPPDSGDHYNIQNVGPIKAAVYPQNQPQAPGGWVHNLEHGWVVVLYRCTGPSDCPSDAEMAQLQAFYDQAPTPAPAQGCDKEVLVARFDSMDTRFAVLAWGRAYLTNDFNLDTALTFAQQWMDAGSEPEKSIC